MSMAVEALSPTAAPTEADDPNALIGYLAALVAVVGFGSNFIPAKKVDTGDGMYFQWIMCCAIWMMSVLVQFSLGNPQFEPFAMVGGFLWCSGNVLSILAIQYIGMGIGLLLWGSTNMLGGWASGTWGWFGIDKSDIENHALNYVGVAVAVVALGLYMLVETEPTGPIEKPPLGAALLDDDATFDGNMNRTSKDIERADQLEARPSSSKEQAARKTLGIAMALLAGVMFGFNFDPVEYLKANPDKWLSSSMMSHSDDELDYVFSHFTGIFFTSTVYFVIYCGYKSYQGQPPMIDPNVTLPAFLTGFVWSIADVAWFIGNQNLSLAVAFPVITSGPGLVGALWGVLLFKEIKGYKNLRNLVIAACTTVIAVTMIALSQV